MEWVKLNFYTSNLNDQMELLGVFVRLVREQMSQIWDKEIVQKVQGMKNDSNRDLMKNTTHDGLSGLASKNPAPEQDMAIN